MGKKVLLSIRPKSKFPYDKWLTKVVNEYALSPYKVVWDVTKVAFSKRRIYLVDYFQFGLYRPNLSKKQISGYISHKAWEKLLKKLTARKPDPRQKTVANKLGFTQFALENNLPHSKIKGFFAPNSVEGTYPDLPLLSKKQTLEFLQTKSNYPFFGKPIFSSLSLGAASFIKYDKRTNHIHLGDSQSITPQDFVEEISEDYQDGFIFQNLITPSRELRNVLGNTAIVQRLLTIKEPGEEPIVLYTSLRTTLKEQMTTVSFFGKRLSASADVKTGKITGLTTGGIIHGPHFSSSPITNKRAVGVPITNYKKSIELACKAHNHLPDYSVIGWDIIPSDQGPVFIECNLAPFIDTFQYLYDTPIINDERKNLFDRIILKRKRVET